MKANKLLLLLKIQSASYKIYVLSIFIDECVKNQKYLQENVFILFWWDFGGFYVYLSAFLSVVCKCCAMNIYYLNDHIQVVNIILK